MLNAKLSQKLSHLSLTPSQVRFINVVCVFFLDNKYLLLTEFEGRTGNYGRSFFPFDLVAQARSAKGQKSKGKKRVKT